MYLAGHTERGSVARVAAFYDISRDHVAKVVQTLVRLGFVRSIRGVGGGIELARPGDQISIGSRRGRRREHAAAGDHSGGTPKNQVEFKETPKAKSKLGPF